MMNAAKRTSLTGCWLKQANGQGIGQIDRQRLARHLAEVGLDDPRRLMLVPLEIIGLQLEAIMLQELEIARGICTNHAEKFEGTARNIMDKFFERF